MKDVSVAIKSTMASCMSTSVTLSRPIRGERNRSLHGERVDDLVGLAGVLGLEVVVDDGHDQS